MPTNPFLSLSSLFFSFKTGFCSPALASLEVAHYVAQDGLELAEITPGLFPSAEIIGVQQQTWRQLIPSG